MMLKIIVRILSGIALILMGIVFIWAYISEAYFARIGEPDQSLLFWYLPLLFIGMFSTGLGVLITWVGYREYKISRK